MPVQAKILVCCIALLLMSNNSFASPYADLANLRWNHGAESCDDVSEPRLQTVQTGPRSFVLRQSKCSTFEAPFMFLLVGDERAVLIDSGAHESADESPVFQTVMRLLKKFADEDDLPELTVLHTHSHADHHKGDVQFLGKPGITVVGTEQVDMEVALGLAGWPENIAELDLGERKLSIVPIPGHQAQSIAIYDHGTGWLLTGDSLYPGYIRVRDWQAYRSSIARLVAFAAQNPVSLVLGTHIEWNVAKGEIYPIGSTWQPDEPPLALPVERLRELNRQLLHHPKQRKLVFDDLIIAPLNFFERTLSYILSGG